MKRSGRDEPMWVAIHKVHGSNARNFSVELSLSLTHKNDMSFLLSHVFSNKIEEEQGATGSAWNWGGWRGGGGGSVTNNVYTCK
jgi:hypothetical protein